MFNYFWRGMDIAHKYDEVPVASADKEFNKHFHNFYEIFYFISGTATYTVENEKRLLHPYDGLVIAPGEFHNVEFLDKTPYERYVLKLPLGHMAPYLSEKLGKHSAFFPDQRGALEIFENLDKAYGTFPDDDYYYYASSLATQAIITFLNNSDVQPNEDGRETAKIQPVLQYINDNIDKQLTLARIAEHFHYTPNYLSREFYRYTKTTVMKYVRAKRVLAAHKLMLAGYKPTQIPEILGYSDYSTFYRSYVSVMGKPPSEDFTDKRSTYFPPPDER